VFVLHLIIYLYNTLCACNKTRYIGVRATVIISGHETFFRSPPRFSELGTFTAEKYENKTIVRHASARVLLFSIVRDDACVMRIICAHVTLYNRCARLNRGIYLCIPAVIVPREWKTPKTIFHETLRNTLLSASSRTRSRITHTKRIKPGR